jgi:hypothetical protein
MIFIIIPTMKFTFGIITNNNIQNVNLIIDSIEKQRIPEYEVIVVGSDNINRNHTISVPFDETTFTGWITKKKNIITRMAKYENIVYTHDYIILDDIWYDGMLTYGDNFDIIINKIYNSNGTRFRDWLLNIDFIRGLQFKVHDNLKTPILQCPYIWIKNENYIADTLQIPDDTYTIFLNYDDDGEKWQKYMYVSGSFFICKKHVMEKYPLNELLLHNQGEDVEWSQRVKTEFKIKFNSHSSVSLLKYKSLSKSLCV